MNHMTVDSPDAPWNQQTYDEKEVEVTVSITMSKTFKLSTNNYEITDYGQDEDGDYYEDREFINLKEDVENSFVLPHNLSKFTKTIFEEDLDLKAAGMPNYLKEALEECDGWEIDDFEVIEE